MWICLFICELHRIAHEGTHYDYDYDYDYDEKDMSSWEMEGKSGMQVSR